MIMNESPKNVKMNDDQNYTLTGSSIRENQIKIMANVEFLVANDLRPKFCNRN